MSDVIRNGESLNDYRARTARTARIAPVSTTERQDAAAALDELKTLLGVRFDASTFEGKSAAWIGGYLGVAREHAELRPSARTDDDIEGKTRRDARDAMIDRNTGRTNKTSAQARKDMVDRNTGRTR
jgi:hypothetical protein